jgi:acetyl-CoA acetyltransferase
VSGPVPCSIVGIGESRHGEVPGVTAEELMAEAVLAALSDAGLTTNDVDGLFTTSAYYWMPSMTLGEQLGIAPRYTDSTCLGGSTFVSFVGHAAAALSAGFCDVAVIAYGSTQRSDGGSLVSMSESSQFEAPLGYRYPLSAYALAAQRHMYEFGTTSRQLAEVAVSSRQWAQLTPNAFAREPLTIEDVESSRVISSPIRLADCCLVTDGAAAFVMTRADRASDTKRGGGVPLLGFAESHEHRHIGEMPDLVNTAARLTGAAAMAMAGVSPHDLKLAMLYDSFTINVPLLLEDLGFCAKGEGGPFVSGGRIAPGGDLAVNTNGGGLSYTHPGMLGAFLVTEAVRQLRKEAGDRQVDHGGLALVHGVGGVLSSHATVVLGA